MLFVISKEKIMSCIIAFSTVAILLGISVVNLKEKNTIQTASNTVIYNVSTNNIVNEE